MWKLQPPPWKKSPPSFPAMPLKSWGPVKPPFLKIWKFTWRFTPPSPSRKGGGVHYGFGLMKLAWIFLKIFQILFPQIQFKKNYAKKFFYRKTAIFCLNFSQGLSYVNFFLGFHFFQRLFYCSEVIIPCYI